MSHARAISPDPRKQRPSGTVVDEHGVCLTELMISLATGAAVLAAALSTFNIVQTHADKQYRTVRHQQDLRLGLEVFEQEVRLATADSIVTAAPDEFLFHANLSAHRTMTTGAIVPGQSVLPVQDGSGWGEGKTVMVCGPHICELHRLARAGQRYQLVLAEPIESSFPSEASVEVRNRVIYYVKRDQEGLSHLMRMVDGGANVLIGGLEDLRFSYWDEWGRKANQPSQVKRVVLETKSNRPLHSMVWEVSVRS